MVGCQGTALPIHPSKDVCKAAESGQKEAERLICHGCWHGLPRLDPKADVPVVKLMGYRISREEIGDLFHQVYMLKRLPGPPPCRSK